MGNPAGDKNFYIIPQESQVLCIWYNRKLFEKHNIAVPKTYAELKARVDEAAAAFLRAGLGKGARIALFLPNTLHHPVAFFGAMKAGATVRFHLDIAARYSVVARAGAIGDVRIDGRRYVLPVALAAGEHTLRAGSAGDYALVWSTAVEQGLSPFADEVEEP